MRDGELCRFSVVADDQAKTIDRSDDARTIDRVVDARTIDRNLESGARQGRTVLRPPSETLLDAERQPKTLSALGATTEPEFGDAAHAPLGSLIDNRYVVEALIARGGMGVVYRCRHKSIGKPVAVKVLRKDLTRLAEAPRRLLIEAQAASAIGNEHIIDITDFGTLPNGSSYLVMELLDGVPLAELIVRHGTLPLARVLAIGKQLAEGLMAAHAAGIVHRDLKPENIVVLRRKSEDFVKILDFGIAKIAPTDSIPLTRAGAIVGTPDYMSPEQAAGVAIDHRVDIYSLGVILYQLATGRVPFAADNYLGLLTKIMTEPPPPFRAFIPAAAVPLELEAVVLRCLAKLPAQRFPCMEELLLALERVEQLSASSAATESGELTTPPPAARRRAARESAPSEEPRSPGSLSAVSGQAQLVPALGARWGIQAMGAALVLSFSLTWLSYLQRGQPGTSASQVAMDAMALPAPSDAMPPDAPPALPLAVAPLAETPVATPPAELAEPPPAVLSPPRAAARKAAATRKGRSVRPGAQAPPASVPEPARSAKAAPTDRLLQPW